mmetsp:Transcript_12026/g.30413  ORF Transcript_12026/g.30413 Transcript_12026/m.30413 type:complete len:254 (-) Transcript_12026:217-978(-)
MDGRHDLRLLPHQQHAAGPHVKSVQHVWRAAQVPDEAVHHRAAHEAVAWRRAHAGRLVDRDDELVLVQHLHRVVVRHEGDRLQRALVHHDAPLLGQPHDLPHLHREALDALPVFVRFLERQRQASLPQAVLLLAQQPQHRLHRAPILRRYRRLLSAAAGALHQRAPGRHVGLEQVGTAVVQVLVQRGNMDATLPACWALVHLHIRAPLGALLPHLPLALLRRGLGLPRGRVCRPFFLARDGGHPDGGGRQPAR